MFTGIIEQTGTLVSVRDTGGARRLTVEAPGLAGRLREGDSLCVSGVCLTALDVNPPYFHADLAQETLDRSSLGRLAPGAQVNLELPTPAGSPLGGLSIQPALRQTDHRLDPQGEDPRFCPPLDGPQGFRSH